MKPKKQTHTPFSAVVVARDEEHIIARCLQALLPVADEVLLVDSGSKDRTPQIAESLGARVLHTTWQGYAQTKNFANRQARHDWILSIDADEVLSEALQQSLQQWTARPHTAYALDRLTNYCGQWVRHSGWYPDWKIRLFDRREARWEGAFVHEYLHLPKGTKIIRLAGKLKHYSYKDEEDHLRRIERYARLSALQMLEQNRKPGRLKEILAPPARFIRTLLLKQGFLDGRLGWKLASRDALLVRRKYEWLRQLQNQKTEKTS